MKKVATGAALNYKKHRKKGRASPPPQKGGRVAIVCDHNPIATDLTVTVILRQTVAQIVGAILISGRVLPGSGGADHIVTHSVWFVWYETSIRGQAAGSGVAVCHLFNWHTESVRC